MCRCTLCSGVAAYYVVIKYAVAWQRAFQVYICVCVQSVVQNDTESHSALHTVHTAHKHTNIELTHHCIVYNDVFYRIF
jgi:hypothetical protein